MRLIFLDIDGVLNCQLFYDEQLDGSYVEQNICKKRVGWLNDLCKDTGAKIVISSTWRMGRTIDEMRDILNEVGATFEIIGMTPILRNEGCVRGNEIQQWIEKNDSITGLPYYDYSDYVIIDDDSDMLLWQKDNFFQTDSYSGLTPNTCYKIQKFFHKKDIHH